MISLNDDGKCHSVWLMMAWVLYTILYNFITGKGGVRASLTCVKQMGAITVISFIEKKKIQEQSNRVHNIRNPRPLLLLHRIAQRVNQKCDYESHMG